MSTPNVDRCPRDGYKYVGGTCPVCLAEQPLIKPTLPEEVLRIPVTREMFITAQHYSAWKDGMPLRRHIAGRKKIDRDLRELVYRDKGRRSVISGSTDYLTVDHIVPVALGGSTQLCNLRPLTERENREYWTRCYAEYVRQLDRYLAAVAA